MPFGNFIIFIIGKNSYKKYDENIYLFKEFGYTFNKTVGKHVYLGTTTILFISFFLFTCYLKCKKKKKKLKNGTYMRDEFLSFKPCTYLTFLIFVFVHLK